MIRQHCQFSSAETQRECTSSEKETAQDQERGARDLYAQRQMAIWSAATGVTAIVSIFLSAAGIIFVWRSLQLTREANAQTLKAIEQEQTNAERQVRAYVGISEVRALPVLVSKPLETFIKINNFGQTPAQNVRVWSRSFFVGREDVASPEAITANIGVLEPQKSFTFTTKTKSNLEAGDITKIQNGGHKIYIVSGVVQYLDAFEKERRSSFRFHWTPENQKDVAMSYEDTGNDAE